MTVRSQQSLDIKQYINFVKLFSNQLEEGQGNPTYIARCFTSANEMYYSLFF